MSSKDLPKSNADVKESNWLTRFGHLTAVGLALIRLFQVGNQLVQVIERAVH